MKIVLALVLFAVIALVAANPINENGASLEGGDVQGLRVIRSPKDNYNHRPQYDHHHGHDYDHNHNHNKNHNYNNNKKHKYH